MKQTILANILVLVLLAVGFGFGYHVGQTYNDPLETTTDTITVHDTLRPDPKIINHWHSRTDTDTVYSVDSVPVVVQIPITTKVYGDSSYRAVVSGYKANLDSISIFRKTITIEKKTYYPKLYKPRWSVGLVGGYGATGTGLSPFIGVGVTYNLFSW